MDRYMLKWGPAMKQWHEYYERGGRVEIITVNS
jgi:hypothetical protein